MKVGYRMLRGGTSKAYLDADEYLGDGVIHYGVNKHNDEPLALVWCDEYGGWIEVERP